MVIIGPTSTPPSIANQPQDVLVNAHGSAAFSVNALGTLPLHYQWSLNNTNIVGATTSTLTIPNVKQSDLGAYAVIVTNGYGAVTSSIANLKMYPYLAVPFGGAVTYWGKDTTLSVGAWGSGALNYQWYLNGGAIGDATNSTLVFTSVEFTNAGLYSVVVSSSLGSVTNIPAQVVVNAADVSLGFSPTVRISGVAGYSYVIQRSVDLTDTNAWVTLANLTLTQPVMLWVDTNVDVFTALSTKYFYRVLPGQ